MYIIIYLYLLKKSFIKRNKDFNIIMSILKSFLKLLFYSILKQKFKNKTHF
jgi:hypothetical protein